MDKNRLIKREYILQQQQQQQQLGSSSPSSSSSTTRIIQTYYGTPIVRSKQQQQQQQQSAATDNDSSTIQKLKNQSSYAFDDQGRRRFHGAFTGGFSAGYFNTVGSKEGFTPRSFISHQHHQKTEKIDDDTEYKQKIELSDIVDDEDVEDWMMNRSSSSNSSNSSSSSSMRDSSHRLVPIRKQKEKSLDEIHLNALFGQTSAMVTHHDDDDNDDIGDRFTIQEKHNRNTHGEPSVNQLIHSLKQRNESIGHQLLKNIGWWKQPIHRLNTINEHTITVNNSNNNQHGMGFIDHQRLTSSSGEKQVLVNSKNKNFMRMGKWDDASDPDSVYSQLDRSDYDFEMTASERDARLIAQPKPQRLPTFVKSKDMYYENVLSKFPMITVPADFVLGSHRRRFKIPDDSIGRATAVPTRIQLSADSIHQRAVLLGENKEEECQEDEFSDPFWSYLKPEDRARIQGIAKQKQVQANQSQQASDTTHRAQPLLWSEETKEMRDKLSSVMTNRFVKATDTGSTSSMKYGLQRNEELNHQREVQKDTIIPSSTKISNKEATIPKETTREIFDWYPEALLCKRLNVPNPKPNAPTKGTQGVREGKANSIFDDSLFGGFKLPSDKQSTTTAGSTQSLQSTTNIEKIAVTHRPSMDIFKSVFGDDDQTSAPPSEPYSPSQGITPPSTTPLIVSPPKEQEEEEEEAFPFELLKQQAQPPTSRDQQPTTIVTPPSSSISAVPGIVNDPNITKLAQLQSQIAQVKRLLGNKADSSSSDDEEDQRRREKKWKRREKRKRKERKRDKKRKRHRYSSSDESSSSYEKRHKSSKHKHKHRRYE